MTAQANPYPLRVEKSVMDKFKVIAKENGRSVNKEIEALMKRTIADYEKTNGAISVPDPASDLDADIL